MASAGGKSKTHRRSLSHPVDATIPTIELPKPKLDLHLQPIKLSSACHDSPMFRKALLKEEEYATEFGAHLKNFTKSLRTAHGAGNQHSMAISGVTTEAQLLFRRANAPEGGFTEADWEMQFQRFIQTIQLGENLRTDFLRQYEEMGIKPLEALQDDISAMKESSRKWQRVSGLADACAIKVAGLKKNSNKLDESEAELADLKKQTEAAAIELGTNLNTLSAKRRLATLDSMCRWVELQKSFIDEYQTLLKDVMPELQSARNQIKSHMDEIPHAVKRIPQLVMQEACVTGYLQGYLYRKTKMNFTRRSYFVLDNGVLSCYENLDSADPKWKLDMLTCTVKPSSEATRNFCFEVISPTKSRTLQADSQETMQRWILAIQEAISAQLDKQRIGKPGRRGSGASAQKSNFEASDELAKREAAIRSLYEADEANRKCADCSDANPTWISLNLGILICLECSGIHRSMGTHISKVRSLTLDSLSQETKSYIMALGNKRVNEIFGPDILTAIPTSFGERLHPHSTRKDREAWIKAKYAEKIFVETYRGANLQLDFVAAIRQQDLARCLLLYIQGANLNYKYESDQGRQPLHYAADGDNALILLLLLQNGAQVNVKDSQGLTPLHLAASGHVACAALLCRMRAKVDVTDALGRTPLSIALESQNADVITLLRLAKLAREGGGMDEKSFAEALDSFTADIHKTRYKTSLLVSSEPGLSVHSEHSERSERSQLSLTSSTGAATSSGYSSSNSSSLDGSPVITSNTSGDRHGSSSKKQKAQPMAIPSSTTTSSSSHHTASTSTSTSHSPSSSTLTVPSTPPTSSSPDTISASPSSKSSFSFLSKLDTKRR